MKAGTRRFAHRVKARAARSRFMGPGTIRIQDMRFEPFDWAAFWREERRNFKDRSKALQKRMKARGER